MRYNGAEGRGWGDARGKQHTILQTQRVMVIMNGDWTVSPNSGHLTPTPGTGLGLQRYNTPANGVFSLPGVPSNESVKSTFTQI